MISVLVEPRGERRSSGGPIALGSLMAYAGVASIAAGIGSPGAGLAVIAMGLLAATIVDFVLWREMVRDEPAAPDGRSREVPALPKPADIPLLTAEPARPERVLISNDPGSGEPA